MSRLASTIFPLFLLLVLTSCGGDATEHAHDDHDHHDHDHGHDHSHHDHDHSGPNAHLWLDPVLADQFVQMLAGPLGEVLAAAKEANRPAVIVASIHPLASLVTELVGNQATVITMLPQGGSPHGFELTPDILRALGNADALVIVGMSLDPWASKAANTLGNPRLVTLTFAKLVEAYQDGLHKPLPADHPLLPAVTALSEKLVALHEKHKAALSQVPVKEMVTFHNAFDLLAHRYGLKVVAHLTEMDMPTGAEVTPAHLREARDAVRKFKLKTLYAEPAYPDSALHAIAEATGAKVLRLDDLGGPDRAGYRTYFEMMESNLKVIVEGQDPRR